KRHPLIRRELTSRVHTRRFSGRGADKPAARYPYPIVRSRPSEREILTLEEHALTEALIYDAIRTPRGKGKSNGSLHTAKPVNLAAQKVASGWEDLVLAGGVESMSRVPMGSDGGAWAMDPETSYDTSFVPQGIGADLIATVEGFSREDVDEYAARSQRLAFKAQSEGRFDSSVV